LGEKYNPRKSCVASGDQCQTWRNLKCSAWVKRRYQAHFVSKLSDSDGEQAETQHWLDTALACEYISSEMRDRLFEKCKQIGRMLGSMMAHPEKFCRQLWERVKAEEGGRKAEGGRKREDERVGLAEC